ncbi:hypothetical protein STVIR_2114 [Streptomyces viridochromogenes Tue57]|uniref:Uncharacterized protein n=1 Tax=Streptomyces viridochromogenes Tue57 TaxID=1160705 RepID=L8PH83_STRVR|nr:hypothetical protein STVIR_2114 [Streptomyces viridochromogenes Tue57]
MLLCAASAPSARSAGHPPGHPFREVVARSSGGVLLRGTPATGQGRRWPTTSVRGAHGTRYGRPGDTGDTETPGGQPVTDRPPMGERGGEAL